MGRLFVLFFAFGVCCSPSRNISQNHVSTINPHAFSNHLKGYAGELTLSTLGSTKLPVSRLGWIVSQPKHITHLESALVRGINLVVVDDMGVLRSPEFALKMSKRPGAVIIAVFPGDTNGDGGGSRKGLPSGDDSGVDLNESRASFQKRLDALLPPSSSPFSVTVLILPWYGDKHYMDRHEQWVLEQGRVAFFGYDLRRFKSIKWLLPLMDNAKLGENLARHDGGGRVVLINHHVVEDESDVLSALTSHGFGIITQNSRSFFDSTAQRVHPGFTREQSALRFAVRFPIHATLFPPHSRINIHELIDAYGPSSRSTRASFDQ